ncbi:ABC drug exporter AtrF [Balamuthia mandrillaris]
MGWSQDRRLLLAASFFLLSSFFVEQGRSDQSQFPLKPIDYDVPAQQGQLQPFHLSARSGFTGLVKLSWSFSSANASLPNVFGAAGGVPSLAGPLQNGSVLLAAGHEGDDASWFFVVQATSATQYALKSSMQATVIHTLSLTSGQPSELIDLDTGEYQLLHLPSSKHSNGLVTVDVVQKKYPNQQLFISRGNPRLLPDPNVSLNKVDLSTCPCDLFAEGQQDGLDWYFLMYAGDASSFNSRFLVVSHPTMEFKPGQQMAIPCLPDQKQTLLFKMDAQRGRGAFIRLSVTYNSAPSFKFCVKSHTIPSPSSTSDCFGPYSGVGDLKQEFLATSDGQDWYFSFVVEAAGNNTPPYCAISFSVESSETQELAPGQRFAYPTNYNPVSTLVPFKLPRQSYTAEEGGLISFQIDSSDPTITQVTYSLSPSSCLPYKPQTTALNVSTWVTSTPTSMDDVDWWLLMNVTGSYVTWGITITPQPITHLVSGQSSQFAVSSSTPRLFLLDAVAQGAGLVRVKLTVATGAALLLQVRCSSWPAQWQQLDASASPQVLSADSREADDVKWWFMATSTDAAAVGFVLEVTAVETQHIENGQPVVLTPLQEQLFVLRHSHSSGVLLIDNPQQTNLTVSSNSNIPSQAIAVANNNTQFWVVSQTSDEIDWWIIAHETAVPSASFTATALPSIDISSQAGQRIDIDATAMRQAPFQTLLRISPNHHRRNNAVLSFTFFANDNSTYWPLQFIVQTNSIPASSVAPLTNGSTILASGSDAQSSPTWYILIRNPTSTVLNTTFSFVFEQASMLEFCDPVITCYGHGECLPPDEPSADVCLCIGALGFGYEGEFCHHKTSSFILLCAVLILNFNVMFFTFVVVFFWSRIRNCFRSREEKRRRAQAAEKLSLRNTMVRLYGEQETDSLLQDAMKQKEEEDRDQRSAILTPEHLIEISLNNMGCSVSTSSFPSLSKRSSSSPKQKMLLQNITATFSPGKLVAIMGPSGAGKSTLLKVLAGKMKHKTTGTIHINGARGARLSKFRKLMGFVPQDDVMHRELSVEENISFSAALRLPRAWRKARKKEMVDQVIDTLKLSHVRHSKIGGGDTSQAVSGGERKRASIGMELAALPSVLFLDEPTSGLDSPTALELVRHLKLIAQRNFTVIAVIHQPPPLVFQQFDQVMLLAKGGRLRYFGPPEEAIDFLPVEKQTMPPFTNPADYFLEEIESFQWQVGASPPSSSSASSSSSVPGWQSTNRRVQQPQYYRLPPSSELVRKNMAFWRQLWGFMGRSFLQQKRDLKGFFLNNFLVILSAFLLGFSFRDNPYVGPVRPSEAESCPSFIRAACLLPQADTISSQSMLTCLAIGLTAVATSLGVFGNERLVFWRESSSGMSETAYFIGKNLAGFFSITLPPLLYMAIFYWLTTPDVPFEKWYGVLVCVQFVCVGMAYLISILIKPERSLIVGVVVVFVCIIISGYNPRLSTIKNDYGVAGEIVSGLSFARWGMEALYLCEVTEFDHIYDIHPGLQYWGYQENFFVVDLVSLVILGFGFRVLAWMALKWTQRAERGYQGLLVVIGKFVRKICQQLGCCSSGSGRYRGYQTLH